MHIGDYSHSDTLSHENIADRKLLLHRKEINTISEMIDQKGKTLIPLSMYFKCGYVKVAFGLAQGKKIWDKRKNKMEKDVTRQIDRELKKARS